MYRKNGLRRGVQLHIRPVLISTTLRGHVISVGKKEMLKEEEARKKAYVKRKVFASNQGVSGSLRLMTNRVKRKVVIAQLLRLH